MTETILSSVEDRIIDGVTLKSKPWARNATIDDFVRFALQAVILIQQMV
jgi:hypothetical protein